MREWLTIVTEYAILTTDAMALVIIAIGSVHAFIGGLRLIFASTEPSSNEKRAVWLGYARVLVAGLTFQLASDILESAIAPDWETVGRLAAIAVVRTFLNYFLERDLSEVRDRQREPAPSAAPEVTP